MKNLELLESLLLERQCKLDLLNFNPLSIPIFHVDHEIWSMRPVKLSKYFIELYKISNVEELLKFANYRTEISQIRVDLFEKFSRMLPSLYEYILLRRQVDNCHRKIGVLRKSKSKF
jgi:hypothetical protein